MKNQKLFAERRITFPDPSHALVEGIVEVSDNLTVERLLEAYSFGIFPWPQEGFPTLWFCPDERGVLDFADLHIPRSLSKAFARDAGKFEFSFDRRFDEVIEHCARVQRPNQPDTWITQHLLDAYKNFHRAGYAHSLEVWREGRLVGGLYGVYVAGVFSGESMFHLESNTSKFAFMKLLEFLRASGLAWIDTQMVTPLLKQFGGRSVARDEYLRRLEASKAAAKRIEFRM